MTTALVATAVQALILIVGFCIGYLFNHKSSSIWRLVGGLVCGFVVSSAIGTFSWVFGMTQVDPNADIPMLVMDGGVKGILFGLVGTSAGVYYGRKNIRNI